MNLADVMQEIADQIDTIEGLRTFGYPPDQPPPAPAAIVTYPDSYNFDESYARGLDRVELPVVVLVGKVSERTARDRLGAYVNGSGASSIKAVVESGTYTAFDSVRVMRTEFDVIAIGAIEYLTATLTLDIGGEGA